LLLAVCLLALLTVIPLMAQGEALSKYPYYRIDWQNRISLSISDAKGRMVFFETPSFKVIDDKPLQVEIQHRAGSVQPG